MKKAIILLLLFSFFLFPSCSQNIRKDVTPPPGETLKPKTSETPPVNKPTEAPPAKTPPSSEAHKNPTAQKTIWPPDCIYKLGDRCLAIKTIQSKLQTIGYKIAADGIYGSRTSSALCDLCKKNKLKYNDYVDKKILNTIDKKYNAAKKSMSSKAEPPKATPPKETGDNSMISTKLAQFLSNTSNGYAAAERAKKLRGGYLKNACAYTVSEVLRRIGINIPDSTGTCAALIVQLKNKGFSTSYDLSKLRPGDICFTTDINGVVGGRPTHTFIFLGWESPGVARIFDNQIDDYGSLYHTRLIRRHYLNGDPALVKEATAFFMYKN